MERLTHADGESYRVSLHDVTPDGDGFGGQAVERLARFENFYDDLCARQQTLAAELEALRAAGRKNSAKFRETLGQKMMESGTLALLSTYGLK